MAGLRRFLSNPWVRWLAPLAVLAVALFLFRDQLPFLGEGFHRLLEAHPAGLLVALVSALLSLLAMAEVMRLLLAAGGTRVPLMETGALTLASNSWSTTLPGGPAFSAIFTYQVQRGWGASIILCGWFFVLSSAISTMWLVVVGLAAVWFLGAHVSIGSLLVTLAVTTVLSWAVYWAAEHPGLLERWARSLLPRLNSLLRRDKGAGLDGVVEQIRQLETVQLSPRRFAVAGTYSLLNRVLDIITLWACVWAVTGVLPWLERMEDHTTLMGVVLAYVTAKLAGSAQVTPGGLGTVEAAIIATLVATGMTAADATAAALVYRLISFAFITVLGWVIYFLHYARRGVYARDHRPSGELENVGAGSGKPPAPDSGEGTGSTRMRPIDSERTEHREEGQQ
ncbi:TIGR00374 family protein [Corynebacterium halotolerans]|uniref:Integral membrane protein n=1 Tax=Corynebacterium halotolerans YIM 70093 = DSM 44683 TaxID=1121362 RepID=M1P1D1_9CORY|nr:TIGR00374 family protein [Corynebacterium halotolerans]AGF73600.1 hypothetical protein A605_13020 [Corynebacterium halotolerans YIM 70093 = DSM 44683]